MTFVLASRNAGKLREMAALLHTLDIAVTALPEDAPEPEENGDSFAQNARIKARSAAQFTGLPALADDSGLCVDALGGAPGIYSARYCAGTDADRNRYLLEQMQGKTPRTCRFVCAIACVWPDGTELTVQGTCEGELLEHPAGEGGFGYDPLFYVKEQGCTFGQLPSEVKNRISHRARAMRALQQALQTKQEEQKQ